MKRYLPIVPILFIFTSTILLIISLTGQTSTSSVALGVYLIKLDFTNLNFSTVVDPYGDENTPELEELIQNLTLSSAGLDEIYLIGTHGHCSGNIDSEGNFKAEYCTSKGKTEFFEPRTMILDSIVEANEDNALSTNLTMYNNNLPQGVSSFWFSGADPIYVRTIYYAILVGAILLGLELCCHVWGLFTEHKRKGSIWLETLANLFSLCGIIATVIGAVVSLNLIIKRTLKYMPNSSFGIDATLGNKRFYLLVWIAFGLEVIQLFTVIIMSCRDQKIAFIRDKEEKEPSDSSYTPQYLGYRPPNTLNQMVRKPLNKPPTYGGVADTNKFLRTPGIREERIGQLSHLDTNQVREEEGELPSYENATGRPSTTNRARYPWQR